MRARRAVCRSNMGAVLLSPREMLCMTGRSLCRGCSVDLATSQWAMAPALATYTLGKLGNLG